MLAYSTLSQIAVMASALAFVLGPDEAPHLALGHLFSHALFKSLLFLAVGWLSVLAGGTAFVALRGRARGRGALYWSLAVGLASLAGLPPLVGFYAKLAVLQALIASGQAIYIGLAVFAVITSLIGAFYYLRVVKVMYFDAPVTASTVSAPRDVRTVLSINGLLILVLGIVPGGLMTLCANAIVATLAN